MSIERASNQLSNKRMVKFQTKANDFVLKRFRKSTRRSQTAAGVGGPGGEDMSEFHDMQSAADTHSSRQQMSTTVTYRKNGVLMGSSSHNQQQQQSIVALSEAIQQAESLRYEIDRVKAGITLVNQSMDKLSDVVQIDTRCCGGIVYYYILTYNYSTLLR